MSQQDPFSPIQAQVITVQRSPRRRSGLGCIFTVFIVFTTLIGIGIGVASIFAPNLFNQLMETFIGIQTVETRAVDGDAAAFDPISAYDSIAAFAGEGAQLVSFDAYYVRSDGTLDLTATYTPSPRVTLEYLLEVPRPDNAPPPGVAGVGGGDKWYQRIIIDVYKPGQRRNVTQTSGNVRTSYSYVNEGMTRDLRNDPTTSTDPFLPAPRCSFRDFWAVALERGAPSDAVAVIEYDEDGYEFDVNLNDQSVRLRFNNNCALIN